MRNTRQNVIRHLNSLPYGSLISARRPGWSESRLFMMGMRAESIDPQRWKQVPDGPWMYASSFDLDTVVVADVVWPEVDTAPLTP